MFDGLSIPAEDRFQEGEVKNGEKCWGLYNAQLIRYLRVDDASSGGSLRSVVRNWFQFLDPSGTEPMQVDILDTYRGNFTPQFYPRRFEMRDVIIDAHPQVLEVLLNTVLYRYGKGGVGYVEFSISGKYLLDQKYRTPLGNPFSKNSFAHINVLLGRTNKRKRNDGESPSSSSSIAETVVVASLNDEQYAEKEKCDKLLEKDDVVITNEQKKLKSSTIHGDSEEEKMQEENMPGDDFIGKPISKHGNQQASEDAEEEAEQDDDKKDSLPDIPDNGISTVSTKKKFDWKENLVCYRKPTTLEFAFLACLNRDFKRWYQRPAFNAETGSVEFKEIEGNESSSNEELYLLGQAYIEYNAAAEAHLEGYAADQMHEWLSDLAETLCEDKSVEDMFGFVSQNPSKNVAMIRKFKEQKDTKYMRKMLVGFDWVGDEFGHPYCLFSHPEFVRMVGSYTEDNTACNKKGNPKFGVRIHAGEGLLRRSACEKFNSPTAIAFTLHMYVLMASIRKYWTNYKKYNDGKDPNIRIGHGVAFLYGCEEWNGEEPVAGKLPSKLSRDVKDFRNFLIQNEIVCELSPTSNHMLLPDSFSRNDQLENVRTLKAFITSGLPVTLCTDDDGIWAIKKCKAHYKHVSVAYEYCHAIKNGEICEHDFELMVARGKSSAFRATL